MAQNVTSQDQMHKVVDEHGNPHVHGTHEGRTVPTATVGTHDDARKKDHHAEGQQQLHRSGSSSSSSVSFSPYF